VVQHHNAWQMRLQLIISRRVHTKRNTRQDAHFPRIIMLQAPVNSRSSQELMKHYNLAEIQSTTIELT
jgi:hypothetical protein